SGSPHQREVGDLPPPLDCCRKIPYGEVQNLSRSRLTRRRGGPILTLRSSGHPAARRGRHEGVKDPRDRASQDVRALGFGFCAGLVGRRWWLTVTGQAREAMMPQKWAAIYTVEPKVLERELVVDDIPQRPELLRLIAAADRGEFEVVVIQSRRLLGEPWIV